ncbi:hypothetical protein [Rodentibacter pneumotropicus]|nr:hypothetical protein [Rodentibacter pneumotropicus]
MTCKVFRVGVLVVPETTLSMMQSKIAQAISINYRYTLPEPEK